MAVGDSHNFYLRSFYHHDHHVCCHYYCYWSNSGTRCSATATTTTITQCVDVGGLVDATTAIATVRERHDGAADGRCCTHCRSSSNNNNNNYNECHSRRVNACSGTPLDDELAVCTTICVRVVARRAGRRSALRLLVCFWLLPHRDREHNDTDREKAYDFIYGLPRPPLPPYRPVEIRPFTGSSIMVVVGGVRHCATAQTPKRVERFVNRTSHRGIRWHVVGTRNTIVAHRSHPLHTIHPSKQDEAKHRQGRPQDRLRTSQHIVIMRLW